MPIWVKRLRPNLRVVILGIILLVMAAGFSLPFAVQSVHRFTPTYDVAALPSVDVIVCLAGARGRIPAAAELLVRYKKAGLHPVLYLSGMGPKADFGVLFLQLEPSVLNEITRDDVYIEAESANTVQNAEWFLRIARERGWKTGVLLTSDYHMKRSFHIFSRLAQNKNQELSLLTYPTKSDGADVQEQFRVSFMEFVKGIYYTVWWRP